ncbi:alcohol dehydrogenase catalytic domain-containing protein [Gordonia polyisoprenivorans]|uniref:alcohol dehydrogenase catalytic domain-containing protein n=1 Tax=Gordonia polyisoprenivorans TaxID=84595 RepID=UPI00223411B5|nr:alcohol dehydrogenase catalytic domain-containing protein [Gordonia polyisoprenivorans]
MRAAVTWQVDDAFDVRDDAARRPAGPGEVAVRVRAAGVCQTDISLSHGAFGQSGPVVLGHEGAGEIIEIGSGVTGFDVGDRVLITWVPPCGRCYHCRRHETYICSNRKRSSEQGPAGLTVGGTEVQAGLGTATFAEETVVPVSGVIALPSDIPFEYAALLGCAVPTGYGAAVNSAQVRAGESVLVIGCGAVGLSALQGARIAGAADLVAVDPFESRRSLALSVGATHAVTPEDDPTSVLVGAPGFDVVIDAVARSSTIRSGWAAARRGGRLVVVGAGRADDTVEFSAQELFHDAKSLVGSYYGAADMQRDVPELVSLWRAGRFDLASMVDGVIDLEKINDVVSAQQSGTSLRTMLSI